MYRQYYGSVTIAERRAAFEAICGDARFDNLRFSITDYLGVVAFEASESATAEMAALHIAPLSTNPRIALATVATRADVLAAIQAFLSHGFVSAPYRVFADLHGARQWVQQHLQRPESVVMHRPLRLN